MRRRQFIALFGGAAAWPLAARAQQPDRVRRLGVLMGSEQSDPDSQARLTAFGKALRELGWIEGDNIRIDYRWGAADPDRLRAYAAELVGLTPDVILAHAPSALAAVQQESRTVPIVFVMVPFPLELGVVASLARPGGNITGFTHVEPAMAGKWLELLKEISPRVSRVAFLLRPDHPGWPEYVRILKAAASSFGVEVIPGPVRDVADIKRVIEAFSREPNGGIVVIPDIVAQVHRDLIIAMAASHRVPAIYPFRYYSVSGGLMSYGTDPVNIFRRSASYIDRILKGAKPGELPVQAPTQFELIINLKTAKALGLDVPLHLQQRADEVIE